MPDSNVPGGGSLPGAQSSRSDLGPAGAFQPKRIPTGLPYGKAKQIEQVQSARPLQNATNLPSAAQPAAAATPIPASPQAGASIPATGGFLTNHPRDIISAIGSHPSDFPNRSVAYGAGASGPRQVSSTAVLADLEDMMHRSQTVPANVVKLYMNLRNEANAAGS